jgi:KaiC/GvpD/RAD55 family RecA-like ATPase
MATLALARDTGKGDSAREDLLKAALKYAERGWQVFPLHTPTKSGCSCRNRDCTSSGKHPRTRNGLKDATTDVRKITAWWKQWPDANIGIVTGQESGLCVLDVDGDAGIQALLELKQERGVPETLRSLTGRIDAQGNRVGRHYYFSLPKEMTLRNSAGKLGNGLDVRGAGGYVVAPPSLHASRLCYEWESAETALAEAPSWLGIESASMRPTLELVNTPSNAIPNGQRNSTLTSLAGAMRGQGSSTPAIERALLEDNRQRCTPPLPEDEIRRIAASVGQYAPRARMKKPASARRPDLVRLSDVQAQPVSWLWEPYIPLEMITVLSGDPGVGKTFLSLAIAASITRGETLMTNSPATASNVLYLTLENSPAHVLRPRFDAQQGTASRLFVLQGTLYLDGETEKRGSISLADIDQLEAAIREANARLVVIDPLQSFLGAGVDLHRSNETRPILDGLSKLAEKLKCAVLIVRHLSKGQSGRAVHRGLGSIDITGAARSELIAAPHPEDPKRRIMAHAKSNLGKFGGSLEFKIGDEGRLIWCGASDLTANELLAPESTSEEGSALEEAKDFLKEALSVGARLTREIQEEATATGISKATLRRAQKALNVMKRPVGFGGGWMLELPGVVQESSELFNAGP